MFSVFSVCFFCIQLRIYLYLFIQCMWVTFTPVLLRLCSLDKSFTVRTAFMLNFVLFKIREFSVSELFQFSHKNAIFQCVTQILCAYMCVNLVLFQSICGDQTILSAFTRLLCDYYLVWSSMLCMILLYLTGIPTLDFFITGERFSSFYFSQFVSPSWAIKFAIVTQFMLLLVHNACMSNCCILICYTYMY